MEAKIDEVQIYLSLCLFSVGSHKFNFKYYVAFFVNNSPEFSCSFHESPLQEISTF